MRVPALNAEHEVEESFTISPEALPEPDYDSCLEFEQEY